MTDPDHLIFTQPPRDLPRIAIQRQLRFDRLACLLKDTYISGFVTIERFEMGLSESISSPAIITPQLPAYG